MVEFAKKHSADFPHSRRAIKYLDIFTNLLTDKNAKVALTAVSSFSEVIDVLKVMLLSGLCTYCIDGN